MQTRTLLTWLSGRGDSTKLVSITFLIASVILVIETKIVFTITSVPVIVGVFSSLLLAQLITVYFLFEKEDWFLRRFSPSGEGGIISLHAINDLLALSTVGTVVLGIINFFMYV